MKKAVYDFTLSNGVKIPSIGFGTWQIADGDIVKNAVLEAIKCGYTHIDTAAGYGNEQGIAAAIRESGIAREKLFITTKLWNADQGYESTLEACEKSLERLGTDYIDLYLIHWPKTAVKEHLYPGCMQETWLAFEKLYKEGRLKSIGVSNFLPKHFDLLMQKGTIFPMVNQIELHPGYFQKETADYCRQHNVIVEAWSPLGNGKVLSENATLGEIARKYNKSIAQISLRWLLQQDILPLPKSVTPLRIAENIDIYDFALSSEDMNAIMALPQFGYSGFHPDNVAIFGPFGG